MPLLVYVATFSEQPHFRRIYCTSSEQLDFMSNYFDSTFIFFKQLFLQSCYFFEIVTFSDLSLLLSSCFFFQNRYAFTVKLQLQHLTIENRQLFRTATFSKDEIVQNKDIYRRATFLKQVLLYSIKFLAQLLFQQG